jgi:hypothetical protein
VAVEYALGAALLVVVSLGAIDALQSKAQDEIESHGATAGAPDLPDAGIPATTSTTSVSPTVPPTTAPPTSVAASTTITSSSVGLSNGNNRWNPRVDVRVTDPSSTVLVGATVQVTWTLQPGGQTQTQTCTTQSTGTCSFQLNDLENRASRPNFVDSVSVTVTSVTGTNPTLTYTPGGTTTTLNATNN